MVTRALSPDHNEPASEDVSFNDNNPNQADSGRASWLRASGTFALQSTGVLCRVPNGILHGPGTFAMASTPLGGWVCLETPSKEGTLPSPRLPLGAGHALKFILTAIRQ